MSQEFCLLINVEFVGAILWSVWETLAQRRDDHNRKIRIRKQRTDVGKYFFVNRTIKSWNQLPGSLLPSFLCKINTFRKRVKDVATGQGIEVGIECK